jgi:tetratricopeptide (TPR) repeat protein
VSRWWSKLALSLLVAGSLSTTVVAVAAVHQRGVNHEGLTARRHAEGQAFFARLAANKAAALRDLSGTDVAPEPALVERLVAILQTEGRVFDDVTKVGEARDHAAELVRQNPTSGRAALLLGELELSLHRIPAARSALATAEALGSKSDERASRLRAELDWLAGDAAKGASAIRSLASGPHARTAELLRLGTLEIELGRYDAADAAFRRAEATLDEEDLAAAASLALYRGMVAEARGKRSEAERQFAKSVDILPSYVPGADHLAELKLANGDARVALSLYERLVSTSPNPEFGAGLASAQERLGMTEEARTNRQRARATYEDLLRRFPEAMAWHGAEFFSSIGDNDRAVTLLQANLALRPNGTSRYALARAQLEVGHTAEARRLIDAALSDPPRSGAMLWTAARIHAVSNDLDGACRYRGEALGLNPAVAEHEPRLDLRCP